MTPQKIFKSFCITIAALLLSCGGQQNKYPMDKRYWDPEDYRNVYWEIRKTSEGQQYPRFSDPETSTVIKKLVDHTNYEVVLTDSELGLNHKAEVAQVFFEKYKDLVDLYRGMDRQDLYVYPEELIMVENWGLGLQLLYFKLGNDRIKQQSDNPNDASVINLLRSNERTILKNFNGYLDNINREKSFSSFASNLSEGINIYFTKLPEIFPEADYKITIEKAESMLTKTQIKENKEALTNLVSILKSLRPIDAQ